MSRVSSLLAVSCLALLAVGTCAQQDWVQPSFIEEEPSQPRVWQQSTSDHLGPVTSLAMEESEPRSLVSTESTMSVSAEAQAQAQAMLAATVTAEGKTHAELLAEVEARAPALWADFKAKFKKVYKDEKARFATFTKNLLRIAALNAKVASSRIPQGLRAIFSQDNAHADLTEDEFKKLLGTAPLQSPNIPVAPPAPRRIIAGRGSSKIRKVFLELKAQIEADAAVDADADAETEVEAEADADADAEAETEMEAETFLPTPGQPCSNVGICSGRAEWCGAGGAAGKPVPYSGVCAGAAVCCMPKGVVPSASVIPTPPTPTPTPVAPTAAPRPPTPAPAPAPVAPAAPVPPVDCDWRSMSSEIRHQGQCGSCWAHSAAATLETAYAIKTGIKLSLSPQQAVDCDTSSHGCNGGQPISALNWWAANGGAATEKKIPYWARPQGTCQLTKDVKGKDDAVPIPVNVQQAIKWTYWSGVPDENELGHQLSSSGVLSVNIDASTIQFYRYGIIDSTCGCQNGFSTINHAVNLEGLGTDAATKYRFWILRNSWSKDWGESGRFRLLFGQNTCAVGVNPVKTSVL